ncbi:MAG TPA: GNAT family N-acetyltransferase [Verrucomicrobiae bacterium]
MRSIGDVSVPFRLADGTGVILRPIAPSDREYIRTGFRSMSPLSRNRRFFAYSPGLSDAQLSYLTEVDQINHVAWVAVAGLQTPAPGLGVARFVRMGEQTAIAEFSFAVIDAMQRKGLGRALLTMLYLSAAERGVRILRAVCLPENQSVVNWLCRLGAEERGCSQETVELDLHVEEISNFSATRGSTADRFARSLDYLGRALAEARAKPRSRSDNEYAGHDEPARHSTCNQQRSIPKHETTP